MGEKRPRNSGDLSVGGSAKKFRIGPPLLDLPPMDVVVMSELLDHSSGEQFVEVGFGKYCVMGTAELRRSLELAAGEARLLVSAGLTASPAQREQCLL